MKPYFRGAFKKPLKGFIMFSTNIVAKIPV